MPVKLKQFQAAQNLAKVQTLMKASLKQAAGKGDVKFVAARNYKIGAKLTSLFLVVETSATAALFLAELKKQSKMVTASTGVAAVTKAGKNTHKILVKQATGGLSHTIISTLVKPALGNDAAFVATTPQREQAEQDHPPTVTAPSSGQPVRQRPGVGPQSFLKPVPQPKDRGVDDWAKTAYTAKAKKTVIASQTPSGEIGSIYLGGKHGRIRTTHGLGPEKKTHKGKTLQFNVNETQAMAEYEREKALGNVAEDVKYARWLAGRLNNVTLKTAPSWAKPVDGPQTARDVSTEGAPPDDVALFEIFQKVSGEVSNWHPSRGAAVKYETDKQTIAVLKAAIKEIDSLYPIPRPRPDAAEQKRLYNLRNIAFYNFVKSRLPKSQLVKAMRDPAKVKVYSK